MRKHALSIALLFVLTLLYTGWLLRPVYPLNLDIGRHLMDGNIIFHHPEWIRSLLYTNFYSLSNTDYSIVNHHWAAGIVFFILHMFVGWEGLQLATILIGLCAVFLFVYAGAQRSSTRISVSIAILLVPMIVHRIEIRPEYFGYLFSGITYAVCLRKKWTACLWALPILFIAWVNVHASFPIGFLILGLFTVDALLQRSENAKKFLLLSALCVLATLVNPFGIYGVLYPFSILNDPGFIVMENQSAFRHVNVQFVGVGLLYALAMCIIVPISLVWLLCKRHLHTTWVQATLATLVLFMAVLSVRHVTLAALMLIPFFSFLLTSLYCCLPKKICSAVLTIAVVISFSYQLHTLFSRGFYLGVAPASQKLSTFIAEENIQGPIFNSFELGGYLLYHLFPGQKPFVYNRPESHPPSFWRDAYIPAHYDNDVWRQIDNEYMFNALVLFHARQHPLTTAMVQHRIDDPEWVPVYIDFATIVFVRNVAMNHNVIHEHAIPRERFRAQ